MNYSSQKTFFKKAYALENKRIEGGYGWPNTVDKQVVKFFNQMKKSVRGGRSLDLGCGQGRHTFFFASQGIDSFGIDYIPQAIEEAQQEARQRKLANAHFSVMNLLKLDFPKHYFDIVLDWSVLDHIYPTDWKKYRQNILRVLKVGGYLMLVEFSAKDSRVASKPRNYKYDRGSYDHYFTMEELEKLFSKNFEFVDVVDTTLKTKPLHVMTNVLLKRLI